MLRRLGVGLASQMGGSTPRPPVAHTTLATFANGTHRVPANGQVQVTAQVPSSQPRIVLNGNPLLVTGRLQYTGANHDDIDFLVSTSQGHSIVNDVDPGQAFGQGQDFSVNITASAGGLVSRLVMDLDSAQPANAMLTVQDLAVSQEQ